MEETVIYSIPFKGRYFVVSEEEAKTIKPEHLKTWTFKHKSYSVDDCIAVGQIMQKSGLMNGQGVGYADALAAAQGKAVLQTILKEWDRKTDTGEALPVAPENIGSLPPDVAAAFGNRITHGLVPTKEEWDSLKKS